MDVAHSRTIAAACSIADAMKTGSPLRTSETEALIASLDSNSPPATVVELIRTFQPYIRGCNWPRYLAENNLPLHGLTDDERGALEPNRPGPDDGLTEADNSIIAESHRWWSDYLDWAADNDPLMRRLETLIGLDTEAAFQIAEAAGRTTDASLTLPDVPEQLRESLPAAVPLRADRTEYPRFLHNLLRAIGPDSRAERGVIRLCGRELDALFPNEVDPKCGTYRYRQARILLEERLASTPDDLDALAWAAELCCRAGDQQQATALAERLWAASARCEPSHLARIVQFSLGHSWDYREPIFDSNSDYFGLMGSLEEEWHDREEPLATALLRRAFDKQNWNADLVQTIIEFDCAYVIDVPDDVMPWDGWVWGALRSGPSGPHYYKQWSRALTAAEASQDGLGVALAVPALIAGAIRKRCQERYTEWLKSLRSYAVTPGERRATAKAVNGIANFREYLPPAAQATLARIAVEFAAEMAAPAEDLTAEAHNFAEGFLNVDRQKEPAATYIGRDVWDRLSSQTQEYVCQALGFFRSFSLSPAAEQEDERDFGLVFVALANAILSEVDVKLRTVLQFRWSVFRDRHLQHVLGSKYNKNIGSLQHLLQLFDSPVDPITCRYAATLRANGIHIGTMVQLIPEIQKLANVRNHGAHAGKIDREKAAIFFRRWFGEGVLRELFEALHPSA